MIRNTKRETIGVHLGYAAGATGEGIVYARLRSAAGERLVRAAFRVPRFGGLGDREVGYAALRTIAQLLLERRCDRVRFMLPDATFADDLINHHDVPPPLVLPYVRLRCTLNQFVQAAIASDGAHDDLTARAKAELAMLPAA